MPGEDLARRLGDKIAAYLHKNDPTLRSDERAYITGLVVTEIAPLLARHERLEKAVDAVLDDADALDRDIGQKTRRYGTPSILMDALRAARAAAEGGPDAG